MQEKDKYIKQYIKVKWYKKIWNILTNQEEHNYKWMFVKREE